MSFVIAFDVYGTLINTHGVVTELQEMMGDQAQAFSNTWRDKQLEYSFRRGLMQNYAPFAVCTRNALDFTCQFYQINLSDAQRDQLMACYRTLPAFDDVETSLATLKNTDARLFAFSNGTADAVNTLLSKAGIREVFDGVVSVDDLKSFKPNPAVYAHFLRQAQAKSGDAWLVSSNPFDVIGAISAGMKAAWLQRSPSAIFDPWGIEPTITITNLNELHSHLTRTD